MLDTTADALVDLTQPQESDGADGILCLATYDWTPRDGARIRSREDGHPARLVLTVPPPAAPAPGTPRPAGSLLAPPAAAGPP